METITGNKIIDDQLTSLLRVTEETATRRELNRVLGILLEWGYHFTDSQIAILVGEDTDLLEK